MPLLPPVMSATYPMPLLPPMMSATYPMPLFPPVMSATYPMTLLPPVMSATYPMPLLPPVMSATYPMPLLPPVISATLSKNRFIFMKNNLKKETGSSTPTLQARINLVSAKKIFKCCKQSSGELFGASERNLTCLKQY